ncbi:carboxypeptidase M32 [Komagataeibacter rhaeticus]|uniref:carboxypeptidase M32 n=1 Tax=Komagataeibacter rhaeticus TaxID=215221 RepID=UPI0004DB1BAB|nr:carboxypeptidase M32 [Komagataeibacter rhaeticus]KDU94350.1 peptidase M32 [Komagataeibacter rhaeticus AF1]MBL7240567.1 carboxypeptidase M32 [Komagataeibacter rhaeticus]PYD54116.1 carboxypeptidase M32 [Komagataeibacter rhaeticus]GBQ18122.1 carboxypeptidase [Komagataeibacter rhaeticus DSM 16663]
MNIQSGTASQQAYETLRQRFARMGHIRNALGILGWDKDTMMPTGASHSRAESIATLAVLSHELMTAPDMAALLDRADAPDDAMARANLREMRRQHAHAAAVPSDLVEAASRAASHCEMAWRTAHRDSDFAALLPALQTVLSRTREIAAAKADALGLSPYDALLDQYDPGTRQADIDPVFAELSSELPDLIATALDHQKGQAAPLPLPGPFEVPAQENLGRDTMRALGFDMARGRLDVSLHPFCGGAEDDVRITTRYERDDCLNALMGVVHETGHALYEQGLPGAWRAQPVGEARGMSLHESQSLLMEMQICRSRPFMDWMAPRLRAAFGGSATDAAWTPENLHRLVTRVRPGFIRVDADEVTYPAHILVRYEMETALIAGKMKLADLPEAFNTRIHDLLGLKVPEDRLGCLQDIHWPSGSWGYFPTYTLGAILAAQLREAAERDTPSIMPAIGNGDFAPLLDWLRPRIHARGSGASTVEIVRDATGAVPNTGPYLRHLRQRYCAEA